jgi:hypothetical protein
MCRRDGYILERLGVATVIPIYTGENRKWRKL